MAWQVKALATNPGDLSPFPRPHMLEGENQLCKLCSDFHPCTVTHTHTQTDRHTHTLIHTQTYTYTINK